MVSIKCFISSRDLIMCNSNFIGDILCYLSWADYFINKIPSTNLKISLAPKKNGQLVSQKKCGPKGIVVFFIFFI
jgi:hypothetical protein